METKEQKYNRVHPDWNRKIRKAALAILGDTIKSLQEQIARLESGKTEVQSQHNMLIAGIDEQVAGFQATLTKLQREADKLPNR